MAESKPSDAAPIETMTFEQAIERLEGLIARIETGQATLEESLAAAEKGARLIQRCRAILEAAEQRVRELRLDSLEAAPDDARAQERGADAP